MNSALRIALIFGVGAALTYGQVATKANERYQTEQGREAVAKGLSGSDRDARQRPKELVQSIGVKEGMTVADVGTGTGYMLPFLSAGVGPTGKVLAEDIFDDFLAKAKANVDKAGLTNVTFVKGSEHGANLPEGSLDVILALDSYHHFNYPADMLASFRKALKPTGRLAIVEYYKREGAMGGGQSALTHIRLDDSGVIKEVEANGFKLIEEHEQIPKSQYVVTFRVAR
ncbi:MAG TPA: methyltransferase domain-containing protein [Bryobacteraceae bacterium]